MTYYLGGLIVLVTLNGLIYLTTLLAGESDWYDMSGRGLNV